MPSVWQLAWPSILSFFFNTLANLAQIKIIAVLGTAALAALMTSHRFFFLVQAVLMGLAVATTTCVARAWGAKRYDEAESYTWNSLVMTALVGLGLTLLVFSLPELFVTPFGLEAEAHAYSIILVRWINLMTIVFGANLVLTAAMRAVGDSRNPMHVTIAMAVTNVLFIFLFTHGASVIPSLGIYGLPVGYAASMLLCNLVFFLLWFRGAFQLKAPSNRRIDKQKIKALFHFGTPAVIEQSILQLGILVFMIFVARYGTAPYAAYGVGVSLMLLSIMIGYGFSIAAATLAGQHIGAGQPKSAKASGWRSTRSALLYMSLFGLLIIVFAEPVARFMVVDDEVVGYTVTFIYFLGAVQPLMALEMTLGGALRGMGDTRFPMISTFLGLVAGRIALALLFMLLEMPVEWIYGSLVADYVIKGLLITWRFQSNKWIKRTPLSG